ncbi:MAG: response regulator [Deltaproteobacteria bacterium]|nr:response regulator [Deltaproteobacteria bacterium]
MSNQHLPILFVDDDPVSHKVIQRYLRDWEVTHVYSGEEALSALREKNVIIVITDLMMPGMHGLELLEEIKKTYGNRVKVVVVTVSV